MFFKLSKMNAKKASEEAEKTMNMQRADIKRRMELVEEISNKLVDAVKSTQEMSNNLTEKVNRELKIARKSLTSISSKLNEGMVMLDYNGNITHVNKAASKIFDISEKDVIGKFLEDVIECANVIHDASGNVIQKPILTHCFFKDLSAKIFDRLRTNTDEEKYLLCNNALKEEIPFCFESDLDTVLGVKIICKGKLLTLTVTLTVLDNDPECIQDVSYIFLFSNHK